jgi:hypothetical protein
VSSEKLHKAERTFATLLVSTKRGGAASTFCLEDHLQCGATCANSRPISRDGKCFKKPFRCVSTLVGAVRCDGKNGRDQEERRQECGSDCSLQTTYFSLALSFHSCPAKTIRVSLAAASKLSPPRPHLSAAAPPLASASSGSPCGPRLTSWPRHAPGGATVRKKRTRVTQKGPGGFRCKVPS